MLWQYCLHWFLLLHIWLSLPGSCFRLFWRFRGILFPLPHQILSVLSPHHLTVCQPLQDLLFLHFPVLFLKNLRSSSGSLRHTATPFGNSWCRSAWQTHQPASVPGELKSPLFFLFHQPAAPLLLFPQLPVLPFPLQKAPESGSAQALPAASFPYLRSSVTPPVFQNHSSYTRPAPALFSAPLHLRTLQMPRSGTDHPEAFQTLR